MRNVNKGDNENDELLKFCYSLTMRNVNEEVLNQMTQDGNRYSLTMRNVNFYLKTQSRALNLCYSLTMRNVNKSMSDLLSKTDVSLFINYEECKLWNAVKSVTSSVWVIH